MCARGSFLVYMFVIYYQSIQVKVSSHIFSQNVPLAGSIQYDGEYYLIFNCLIDFILLTLFFFIDLAKHRYIGEIKSIFASIQLIYILLYLYILCMLSLFVTCSQQCVVRYPFTVSSEEKQKNSIPRIEAAQSAVNNL